MKRLEWNKYFMMLAKFAAIRSGCNSRPTGAVVVKDKRIITTGYNGTISGFGQCTDHGFNFCLRRSKGNSDLGEDKYKECPSIHAEQNAINQIARYGGSGLENASIYCTLFPCIYCLKNIKSIGINKIFYEIEYYSNDEKRDKYWNDQIIEYGFVIERIYFKKNEIDFISNCISNATSTRRIL